MRGRLTGFARLCAVWLGALCAFASVPQQFASAAAAPSAAFFVGADGALYTYGRAADGTVTPATRIGAARVAPPGGGVAATQAPDGEIAGFYFGNDGALYGACPGDANAVQLSLPGLGQPGAPNSAALTAGVIVYDAFVGADSGWHILDIHNPCSPPPEPPSGNAVESPTLPLPPPHAQLASAGLADGEFAVFFVDARGALQALWRSAAGVWTSSQLAAPGTSAPGGGVAVTPNSGAAAVPGALSLFLTEHDGRVYVAHPLPGRGLSDDPHPSPWSPATSVPDGASLTASSGATGTFVGYVAANGAPTVAFVNAGGALSAPFNLTDAGFATPGSSAGSSASADDDFSCGTGTGRPVHIKFGPGGGGSVTVAGPAGLTGAITVFAEA